MDKGVIIENLYDLYNYLEKQPQISFFSSGSFNTLIADGYEWPSITYSTTIDFSKDDLDKLKHALKNSTCKTLIVDDSISENQLSFLKDMRFKPMVKWYNMGKELNDVLDTSPISIEGLDIILCQDQQSISDWVSIVSNVLFKGRPIPYDIFCEGVNKGVFKLLLGKIDGKPTSTILVYHGKTAGIYMVATLPQYQKRGVGKTIMKRAEDIIYEIGNRSVQLHSTHAGFQLYSSLGYKAYGSLILFNNIN
jgi:GNAT superfamily N-acetyltransferase